MRSPIPRRWSCSGTCLSCARKAFLLALGLSARALAADPLPALQAESQYTVSGVSSGAYMAVQFHVAHSTVVKGAGAIAGGPYYCAQGSFWTAYYNCTTPGWFTPLPAVDWLKAETDRLAVAGRIDPPASLASARVWLFRGTEDRTVAREVVDALRMFYRRYKADVRLVADRPAGHAMVTTDSGNACPQTAAPYINDCDYDAAGALLTHLLGKVTQGKEEPANLLIFDQTPFGARDISMADEGYVYVPNACRTRRCRVHIAFHGCRQTTDDIGERFVREAGYNRWAEGSALIVLYPQAIKRFWATYNPRGCWDWWGYTGAQYATKQGPQIRAVKAMLERLSAGSRAGLRRFPAAGAASRG
jgi:poly(3-hydroxybutyrate) depolymerase